MTVRQKGNDGTEKGRVLVSTAFVTASALVSRRQLRRSLLFASEQFLACVLQVLRTQKATLQHSVDGVFPRD
jgi:hypothetical protein